MHDDEDGNHVLRVATQVLVMAIVISVMLLFLGIGILVLIHACIVGRTMRSGASERNTHMEERGSLGSTSMSRDDIEKLPCFDVAAAKARAGGGGSPAGDCAVCLEGFKMGERCRLLPSCNHSFHADCVDLWLLRTPVCPICRAAAADEREDGGGDERESTGRSSGGGGDLGLNQTVVDVVGFDLSAESQRGEAMESSERVVEMRDERERC